MVIFEAVLQYLGQYSTPSLEFNRSRGTYSKSSKFYDINTTTINKEIEGIDYDNINSLMIYEGRIALAYWTELSRIFNRLAPDFNFQLRKNLSYSWNMNASNPANALLNYGYAILESMVRKHINAISHDASIGYLHEIAPSKHPLVYDLQELLRSVVDYSVIKLLEMKLKKSDFITTNNYHIRLRPDTAKLLIEKSRTILTSDMNSGINSISLTT